MILQVPLTFELGIMWRHLLKLFLFGITFLAFSGLSVEGNSACAISTMLKKVSHPGCTAVTVAVGWCGGMCQSLSKPLMDKPWFRTSCHCCRRLRDEVKVVQLSCADGSIMERTIVSVTGCACQACKFS